MNFALTPELEELIRRKVASGGYQSPAHVVEEALLLLEERDHLAALRRERLVREMARGIFEADNHQLIESAQVFHGLSARANATDE
jgi:antitoxin ParD1/3/4